MGEKDELMTVNVDQRFESLSDEDPVVSRNLHDFLDASKSVLGLVCTCVRFVDQGRLPLD